METVAYITYSACHQLNNLPVISRRFRRRVTLRVTMTVSLVLLTVASNCPKPLTNMLPYLGDWRILSNQRWRERNPKNTMHIFNPANPGKTTPNMEPILEKDDVYIYILFCFCSLIPRIIFLLLAWVVSFRGYMLPDVKQSTTTGTTLG